MRTDAHTRLGFAVFLAGVIAILFVGACASEPRPRPTVLDPSNPAAPESAPLTLAGLTPTVHAGVASPRDEPKGDDASDSGKPVVAIYSCPMHPEVTSDKPGRCPQCGMTLVPKEPSKRPKQVTSQGQRQGQR